MKIVVTGVAGFIGSHLAETLAKQGHVVVSIDSFTDYYAAELKQANAEDIAAAGVALGEVDQADRTLERREAGAELIADVIGEELGHGRMMRQASAPARSSGALALLLRASGRRGAHPPWTRRTPSPRPAIAARSARSLA